MGKISRRDRLQIAQAIKNDEYYTRMCDIEKECFHYLGHFRDKVIYCNTDTEESNFVKYFMKLKQQGLIKDVIHTGGLGGLDFRSPESIELLKRADIVVSNPPFSLYREYVKQIIDHGKDYLIIGNQNSVTYRYILSLFKDGKMWLGTKSFGVMWFNIPDSDALADISTIWFTNLRHAAQAEFVPNKTYAGNETLYPKYDNADAINVDRVSNIPADYYGVMGVPITYLAKWNPAQFDLLGIDEELTENKNRATINGRRLYARLFIRRREKIPANNNFHLIKNAA